MRPPGVPNKASEGGRFLASKVHDLLVLKGKKEGLIDIAVEILMDEKSSQRAQVLTKLWEWQFGKPPQEIGGPDGGPIAISVIDPTGLRNA